MENIRICRNLYINALRQHNIIAKDKQISYFQNEILLEIKKINFIENYIKNKMVDYFKKDIQVGNTTIGSNHPPFIIAEMSGNHNKSLKRALKIVEEAKNCG